MGLKKGDGTRGGIVDSKGKRRRDRLRGRAREGREGMAGVGEAEEEG